MNEEITDRLCGLVARLRQQHIAIGATLGEIEACLAELPPNPEKPSPAAARSTSQRPAATAGAPPRPAPLERR